MNSLRVLIIIFLIFPVPGCFNRENSSVDRMDRMDFMATRTKMTAIQKALQYYQQECHILPQPGKDVCINLLKNPGISTWKGPYIEYHVTDSWGGTFRLFSHEQGEAIICSLGPDGKIATEDDIWISVY